MKAIPFGWVFAGAAVFSCLLSVFVQTGPLNILGGLALLYLFGLMLVGVFKPSAKPFADTFPEPNRRPIHSDLPQPAPGAPDTGDDESAMRSD